MAIPLTNTDISEANHNRHEHVNVEYWGFALTEGNDWNGGILTKKTSVLKYD